MGNVFLQYAFIFFVSMIPFVEVFVTVPIGTIVFNLPPVFVLIVAVIGNIISVSFFIFFGAEMNKFINKFRKTDKSRKEINPKIKESFDRFGATGVSFFSSLLFSSQVGAGAMISFGASKSRVFVWTAMGVSTLASIMAILSVIAEELVISLVNL